MRAVVDDLLVDRPNVKTKCRPTQREEKSTS